MLVQSCQLSAVGAGSSTLPEVEAQTRTREDMDPGWWVVVLNDEVNLMSYVVWVFRRVLGFDQSRAEKHMLEVHHQGRSVVAHVGRERAEFLMMRLQTYGLRAILERPPKPSASS